jgi:O-antigen ligase
LVAGIVGFALIFRDKWRWLALASGLLFIIGIAFGGKMLDEMKKDVAILERFNRFACALRMAQERPLTGFGPGTFQFQYVPFQKEEEMTRISTKKPVLEKSPDTYGRGGGVHSEFFQALSEAGWPGFMLWTLLVFAILKAGFKRFFQEKNKENQRIALALTLSLLTFFLHGLVNNMLHDGRIAALFWAMAVALGSEKVPLPSATATKAPGVSLLAG